MSDPLNGERWRMIHGDALDVLKTLEPGSVDTIVTDPPYNVGQVGWADRRNDFAAWCAEWIRECLRVSSGPVVVLMASTRLYDLPRPDWIAIWNKPLTLGYWSTPLIPHWEAIALYRPMKAVRSDVFSSNPARKATGEGHPTPKPVSLMREILVAQAPREGFVLDPFCGSGTTGVACVLEGMCFLGIEREAEYVEIARRRIAEAAAQGSLFEAP